MEVETVDERWPGVIWPDDEPRQKGTHLSDLTRPLLKDMGYWKGKGGFTDMELTAEIGTLWEEIYSRCMADKYIFKPPQIQKDGIWLAPDGIGPDPAGIVPLVVEEVKFTWKSTKSCPTEQLHYMLQLKSYCYALDTTVGIMRIFHCMGDYKGSGPIYRVSRIVFTQRELERNWEMILRARDK